MDKIALLQGMVVLADWLDEEGFLKEAKDVDRMMEKVAYVDPKKVKEYEDAHPGWTLNINGDPVKKEPPKESDLDKLKEWWKKKNFRAYPYEGTENYDANECAKSDDKTLTHEECKPDWEERPKWVGFWD